MHGNQWAIRITIAIQAEFCERTLAVELPKTSVNVTDKSNKGKYDKTTEANGTSRSWIIENTTCIATIAQTFAVALNGMIRCVVRSPAWTELPESSVKVTDKNTSKEYDKTTESQ